MYSDDPDGGHEFDCEKHHFNDQAGRSEVSECVGCVEGMQQICSWRTSCKSYYARGKIRRLSKTTVVLILTCDISLNPIRTLNHITTLSPKP